MQTSLYQLTLFSGSKNNHMIETYLRKIDKLMLEEFEIIKHIPEIWFCFCENRKLYETQKGNQNHGLPSASKVKIGLLRRSNEIGKEGCRSSEHIIFEKR